MQQKTVKFYTLGCKVNQYETQAIREQLLKAGFQELEDSAPADICLINTCTVTHRADSSSISFIRRAQRQNPTAGIVVTGCLTEYDSDKISDIPGVSLIIRNQDKNRILCLLNNSVAHRVSSIQNRVSSIENRFGITYFKNHTRAFIKIQDGCNYNCSYCKVRLVRGKSRSRAPSDIKKELAALINNGYLEIVFCGICLGSYGRDLVPKTSLAGLIQDLENMQGNFRIRLSSIEVNDITNDLLYIMKESSRVCPHLHIPVQSGDKQILRQMNRAYSPDEYIRVIQKIRNFIPKVAITTDVMVGFPGETEDSFSNTVKLIKKIKPSRTHIFPYSKRENTPAYNINKSIPDRTIKARIENLARITQGLREEYFKRFIFQVARVLVEREVPGSLSLWEGYTDNYIRVRIKSNQNLKNRIIPVKLKRIYKDFVLTERYKKKL